MKQKLKNGDEFDWVSKKWRHALKCFKRAGLGRKVKRAMNKRVRKYPIAEE